MSYTFTHHVPHPTRDELIEAEIGYKIEDIGVMGKPNEKLVAVLTGVIWQGQDLIETIGGSLQRRLEDEAFAHWQDQRDLQRFGVESI